MGDRSQRGDPPERHPVLARQLDKVGVQTGTAPSVEQWRSVLDRIDHAYRESDRSRYLSERSTELVSEEMQRLHARVLADKRHLQGVTDAIADGILGVDAQGSVVVANPAALHLLGRTEDDTLGRPIDEVLQGVEYGGGSPIAVGAMIRDHLTSEEAWSFDTAVVMTEEEARHLTISLTPVGQDHEDAVATLVLQDITADVLAERERHHRRLLEAEVADRDDRLAQAERRAVGLIENVTDIIALISPDLDLTWASPSLERTLGHTDTDLASVPLIDLLHPADLDQISPRFDDFTSRPGARLAFDARIRDGAGRYRWLEIVVENHLGDPVLNGFVVCGSDIHRRVQHVHQLESQAEILEMISADRDLDAVLQVVAASLVRATDGVVAAAVVAPREGGRAQVAATAGTASPPDDSGTWRTLIDALPGPDLDRGPGTVPDTAPWTGHVARVAADGIRPIGVRALAASEGAPDAVLTLYGSADDPAIGGAVPELLMKTVELALTHHRRRLELERRALEDPLTGLPNRWHARIRLRGLLASVRRDSTGAAVLFVDLDDLKRVNDSLGHAVGDEVLKLVADRISRTVREADLLCRFGGDEFVIVCEHFDDGRDAVWVAERILDALREPVEVGEMTSAVTASIGIAHLGPAYRDADAVLRDADAAMYRAKAAGRDQYAVFDDVMRARALRRIDVETGLRAALDDGQIVVRYQPQFRPDTGEIVAVEALARWDHPDQGILEPLEWIEVAEQSGLIGPISEQVLAQTCELTGRLDDVSPPGTTIELSVNVAAGQLEQPGLVDEVIDILDRTAVAPERMCLELTESSLADLSDPLGALASLKRLGLRLAVDDWGTGYSSLEYLRELPVDELKVDQSFIQALDEPDGVKLVRGICQLGRALDLDLVAEGVETAAQFGHVRAFRFDRVQGNLLCAPVPDSDLLELVRSGGDAVAAIACAEGDGR